MHLNAWLTGFLISFVGTPALIAFMSFAMWENGFKELGWKRIVRMQIASVTFFLIASWLIN